MSDELKSDADYLKIAEEFHNIAHEVEREYAAYPYREFISFYGMPLEYQTMVIRIMRKLDEKGLLNHE